MCQLPFIHINGVTFAIMLNSDRNNRQIANWLLLGVFMIIVQILIGGITRLTESGLSITEWKPITGALPPLNEKDWMAEFQKYMRTDQFKYVHSDFTISDFKFIYFWEWFHRQWARLLGVVFLVGFFYFLARKKFSQDMVLPMIILFLLGALQGAVGWIMVKSGLVPEKYYVGHVELTTHLIAAIILLIYTLWFALSLLPSFRERINLPGLRKSLLVLSVLVFIQLIYGGFMAGLKAAYTAPTWPDINGSFLPAAATDQQPFMANFVNNNLMVHFVHRGLAYVILILSVIFFLRYSDSSSRLFRSLRSWFMAIIILQVFLGVLTVLNSTDRISLAWFGVLHQFMAMLLVMVLTMMVFLGKRSR